MDQAHGAGVAADTGAAQPFGVSFFEIGRAIEGVVLAYAVRHDVAVLSTARDGVANRRRRRDARFRFRFRFRRLPARRDGVRHSVAGGVDHEAPRGDDGAQTQMRDMSLDLIRDDAFDERTIRSLLERAGGRRLRLFARREPTRQPFPLASSGRVVCDAASPSRSPWRSPAAPPRREPRRRRGHAHRGTARARALRGACRREGTRRTRSGRATRKAERRSDDPTRADGWCGGSDTATRAERRAGRERREAGGSSDEKNVVSCTSNAPARLATREDGSREARPRAKWKLNRRPFPWLSRRFAKICVLRTVPSDKLRRRAPRACEPKRATWVRSSRRRSRHPPPAPS